MSRLIDPQDTPEPDVNEPMNGDDYSAIAKDEYDLYNECHRLFKYEPETGLLIRRLSPSNRVKVGEPVGSLDNHGYLRVSVKSKLYKVHRIIWLMVAGYLPKEQIDHINNIPSDNRFDNLREATNAENSRNRGLQSNNTTGFKGVSFTKRIKNPYGARIIHYGVSISLGNYKTPEEAYQAYCQASEKLHGKFSKTGQKFDISAYQIASAISRNEEISVDEAELLKQSLITFIQETQQATQTQEETL